MSIQFISTNLGRAKLAQSGIGNVTLSKIGVATMHQNVDETSTVVPNELKQIPISGQSIDGAHVHLSFADNSQDIYSARCIGIYLSDGTLFAIFSQPTAIFEKTSGNLQVISIDLILVDLVDSNLSFPNVIISNPPATTSIMGVVELATNSETRTGTDNSRAITPSNLKDYIDWRIAEGINAARFGNQFPAFYTDIIARLGYEPLPNTALDGVWTNLNDGPNSGLSADTLWNFLPSDFAKSADFAHNLNVPGTIKLPGEAKIKFAKGQPSSQNDGTQFVAFDEEFQTTCLIAVVSTSILTNSDSDPHYQIIGNPTISGVSVRRQYSKDNNNASPSTPFIIAIGY